MSLELCDISHRYGGAGAFVVEHANLKVAAGEIVGLVAPSGAGKSTLLSIAAGLLAPSSGGVRVATPDGAAHAVGYLPQSPRAFADPRLTLGATICAPLAFAQGRWRPRPKRYASDLQRVSAEAKLDAVLLDRKPMEVSDGQLQRALMARTLITDPCVIVADEPTAQLDQDTTRVIFQTLSQRALRGAAVLIASHDVSTLLEFCTRVLDLDELVSG
ncbi:ATP-binding cassette domain-containing protein [Glutamicibacter sp.]|uniref:ATP-binding cassette domain-containing protein n=1 Tax=Glutamicibacter sp. TaxID=1931995 RepID=UPI0028BE49A2|nr:ATP-binding cassette domain-containing protein [Glutamicibacter sp.]